MTLSLHTEATRQFARSAWLLIVSHGGWWSPTEVGKALKATGVRGVTHNRLDRLAKAGYLCRRELPPEQRTDRPGGRTGPRERIQYAVKPDCVVPTGLTAREVSAALMGTEGL